MISTWMGHFLSTTVAGSLPFTAIAADGWQTTVASPTDLSLTSFTASRQGFDATGATATISDTLYLTKRVRQAYPNQASFTANNVALSDYLLSTDSVTGAVNNSTLASPKPIAAWVMPSRIVVASTVHWEITAFHYFGRPDGSGAGQQVACIRVRANDGTTQTAWQTVTSPTLSSYVEDAVPLQVYQGDLTVTGLADNSTFWLEAEIYPWIGGAASVLKSEDNFAALADARTFTRRYFVRNTTRAASPNYVYVASTGNDATGVISTTAATAAATPCLTVGGAITRARAALGGTSGAFDGLRIRIVDTVNTGNPTFNTYGFGVGAVVIERAPGTARAAAIVNVSAAFRPMQSAVTNSTGEFSLLFNDVTVKMAGAFTFTGEATCKLIAQFWNISFDLGSFTSSLRSNSALSLFGVVATNYGSGNFGQSSAGALRCARGVTADLINGAWEGWVTLGCILTRASNPAFTDPSVNGHIWFNNKYPNPHLAGTPLRFVGAVSGGDLGSVAMVQNFAERLATTNTVGLAISADGAFGNITHAVILHNVIPGAEDIGRMNIAYDEHATVARSHKFVRFVGNLGCQLNTKGDIFTTDGTRLGNFAFHHGVGCVGTFTRYLDANLGVSLSFKQAYPGIGSVIAGGDPLYTNYQAVSGTTASPVAGAGGGTYTLQSGSPAKNIVSKPVLPYDLAGNARGTGTQHAGAYA